jgi:hypothetical protein
MDEFSSMCRCAVTYCSAVKQDVSLDTSHAGCAKGHDCVLPYVADCPLYVPRLLRTTWKQWQETQGADA